GNHNIFKLADFGCQSRGRIFAARGSHARNSFRNRRNGQTETDRWGAHEDRHPRGEQRHCAMPKPSTVSAPAELLAWLFATWPEVKKKQIRTWLKFQAVTVNGRPLSQFNHPLKKGDVVAIRTDRFAVPKTKLGAGMKVYF